MRVFIGPYPRGKSKKKRRINVRIHDYDTWSLDHTLAYIVLPALKKLRRDKCGAPGSLFDLSHHAMKDWKSAAFKRAEKASDKAGFNKWHEILDAMIWSFDQIVRDSPDEPDIAKNRDDYDAYEERISNGLKLFGQWYRALWT